MDYESIKKDLSRIFIRNPLLTKLFFLLTGRLFLRVRYVKRELKQLMAGFGEEKISVLDAGFGYGQYSYFLARKYPHIDLTAGEIIDSNIERFSRFAEAADLKNIIVAWIDLRKMDFGDSFDLALSVDVMEHIEDDRKVFANIHRSLKSGGVFLLHTPHIPANHKSSADGAFHNDHVREGYSTAEIQEKLTESGFVRIEFIYTYGSFGQIAWRMLQKTPITLANKSRWYYLLLPFYFILVYPLAELCMWLDVRQINHDGNGILVKAWKRK